MHHALISREIGTELNVDHSTICRHLKTMGKHYLVNKWVPHKLSEANKENRVAVCQRLLDMYNQNNFLNKIITVDESWIYWGNIGHGKLNRSWRGTGDEPTFTPKSTANDYAQTYAQYILG